jgi:hypothetical protein
MHGPVCIHFLLSVLDVGNGKCTCYFCMPFNLDLMFNGEL